MITVDTIKPGMGAVPAVALFNPKYPHNVGAAVRAASCYGVKQVWFSGTRVHHEIEQKGGRIPREERMRGYQAVETYHAEYFFDAFDRSVTPVAVELVPGSESLITFEHPENALYVFGPEDGSLPPVTLRNCHRFVSIPTRHCTNLAAAVYTVLYDRHVKRVMAGLEDENSLVEERGFIEPDHMSGEVGLI
jgi:tRNA(Leu) C34 or U34 (ribose-2'-O)-methylase TrmL